MAKSVGIDLGSFSTKIVGLENAGKGYRITHFSDDPIPATVEDGSIAQHIAGRFKDHRLSRDSVVMGLDAHGSIIRESTVDFTADETIRKTIKFHSEQYLFSYGIDEVIVDYVKIREHAERSDVVVIAVIKNILAEKLRSVEEAYVDPIMADLDLLAHYNSLSLTPYPDEHAAFALLDIGYKSMKLMVIENGKPVQLRGMRGGYSSIISAIAGETQMSPSMAEAKVRERLPFIADALPDDSEIGADDIVVVEDDDDDLGGEVADISRGREELEDEFLAARMVQFRKRVVREVNRSLARIQTQTPVNLLLVTGGGSTIPGITDSIARDTGIEVQRFDILNYVAHPFNEEEVAAVEPFISAPLGLALKPIGGDKSGTQFRQEEYAFQKRFEQIKVPLTLCLMLLLGFLVLVWFNFNKKYKNRLSEYDVMNWHTVHTLANVLKEPDFQKFVDKRQVDQAGNARVRLSKLSKKNRFRRHKRLLSLMKMSRTAAEREMGKMSETDQRVCAYEMWNEAFSRIAMVQKKTGSDLSPIIPSVRVDQNGVNGNFILRDGQRETPILYDVFRESDILEPKPARNRETYKDIPGATILKLQEFPIRGKKRR